VEKAYLTGNDLAQWHAYRPLYCERIGLQHSLVDRSMQSRLCRTESANFAIVNATLQGKGLGLELAD
jgi:hypothetical protein